jgi:opacity protein-like surface antigen
VNPRTLIGAALTAAIMASTIAAAGAQTVTVPQPVTVPGNPYPYNGNQYYSNVSVGRIANRVGRVIRSLERDNRDYAGHRVAAINDLGNARNELLSAKQFAVAHGYGQGTPPTYPVGRPVYGRRNEAGSNYSIALVRQHVGQMISRLERDNRDYGGHRVAGINWLQQASNELGAAEQWEMAHPNG